MAQVREYQGLADLYKAHEDEIIKLYSNGLLSYEAMCKCLGLAVEIKLPCKEYVRVYETFE